MAAPTDPTSSSSPDPLPPTGGQAGPGEHAKAKALRGQHALQAPTGTRDFYPAELNRLRYIQKAWRDTSIAHGFDEIDGPTFEHLDLYTIKSGEGIVSELFSFERFGGEKTFALRPEFTPTLARLYAARASSLPKPTKWFWQQNCFRAERPQRGRLREFSQWNCDIIGDDSVTGDAECILTCIAALERMQLRESDVRVRVSDRTIMNQVLSVCGVDSSGCQSALNLLDARSKLDNGRFQTGADALNLDVQTLDRCLKRIASVLADKDETIALDTSAGSVDLSPLWDLREELAQAGVQTWIEFDPTITRGLAYYTGMVFEVHEATGAERAIAGGGRYDGLIELFGGPPTPAVGFGMGDVVLSLVLQDKGLLPADDKIADELGLTPDALVVSNGTPEADAQVGPVLASLRKTKLHARRSYKATKNVGKLIQEAAKMRARWCVIIESATTAQVKDMRTQEQVSMGLDELAGRLGGGQAGG